MSLSIDNLPNRKRIPILLKELGLNGLGVELGVAKALYSKVILQRSDLKTLYGIDLWERRKHTTKEYHSVLKNTKKWGDRFVVIRKSFEDAVNLFEDSTFDFIYVDGFAHEGQCEGNTMRQWYPKLRVGGIMAIHDYSPRYPLNIKFIKVWAREFGLKGYLTQEKKLPSWITQKIR